MGTQYEDDMRCRICLDPQSIDNESHVFFSCFPGLDGLKLDQNVKFEHIYQNLDKQIPAIKNFMKIIRKRKLMLQMNTPFSS